MTSAFKELEQKNADNTKEIQLLKDENKSLLDKMSVFGEENAVPKKVEVSPVFNNEPIQKEDSHDKVCICCHLFILFCVSRTYRIS